MRETIKTERLLLRPISFDDAPAFGRLANDYDIAKMTGSIPHPFPLLSAEFKVMNLIGQYRRGWAYPYAVTLETEFIGIIDLFLRDAASPFEIGYWIGRPFWGQGYLTEAATAFINEAQRTLGVTTLLAGVFTDNPASIKVLEKLGFEHMGASDPYFSIARLKTAESLDMRLTLKPCAQESIAPCAKSSH